MVVKTKRKIKEGIVVSNKMEKTVVVNVERTVAHPLYKKVMTRGKKYYVHTTGDIIPTGSRVRIEESKPISKLKRWKVIDVIAK